jgi:hypothetical protein
MLEFDSKFKVLFFDRKNIYFVFFIKDVSLLKLSETLALSPKFMLLSSLPTNLKNNLKAYNPPNNKVRIPTMMPMTVMISEKLFISQILSMKNNCNVTLSITGW